jgi:hypothetical protein
MKKSVFHQNKPSALEPRYGLDFLRSLFDQECALTLVRFDFCPMKKNGESVYRLDLEAFLCLV